MKNAFLALVLANLSITPVWAVDLWWDTNGTTAESSAGTSANGAWTGTNLWNSDSTGGAGGALSTWVNGADIAHLSAGTNATGTSTISGSATVGGIVVEEGRVVVTGTITAGAGTISVNSGTTLSFGNQNLLPLVAGNTVNLSGTLENTIAGANGTFFDVDANIVLGPAITGGGNGTFSYTTAGVLNIIQTGAMTISGPGAFVKEGAGILALGNTAANNTWTGGTIVNNGTLRMRNNTNEVPVNTAVTINNSATFDLDIRATSIGSLSSSSATTILNMTTGSLTITGVPDTGSASTTFAGVIQSTTGTVTKNGGSTLTLTGANTYTTNTTLGNQANNVLEIGNGGTTGSIATASVAVAANAVLKFNRSNDVTYAGTTTGAGTVRMDGGGVLHMTSATEWGNTGGVVINNGTIRLDNAATGFATTVPVTINNAGILDMNVANDTFGSLVSANTETTGELRMGIRNVTLGQTAATARTYNGTITGSGTLTKAGGTWTQTLSGNSSSYSGNIVVSQGKLAVGHNNALGSTAGNTDIASGAELLFQGGVNITTPEPINVTGIGGTDNGAIAVIGSSTVDLAGPVTLAGDTQVTAGSGSSVTYSNANAITGTNTNLTVQGAGNTTVSGVLSLGTGGLTKNQSGILTLSGANVYSGGTTVSAGTLLVNNTSGSGTGSGSVTVAGGSLDVGNGGAGGAVSGDIINNATVNFNRSDTSTYSGLLSGTGVVNKLGGGKLILTGNNSYGGATNVNGGTLQVDGAHSGTGLVTVNAGATLGGNGSLAGPVTLAGGNVGAGGSIGTFNTGALALNSGNFDFEFSFGGGTVADNAVALGSDVWNVSGLLTIMNAVTLVGTDLGTIAAIPATKFTVLTYTSAATDFRFGNALADDSTIVLDGVSFIINYDDTVAGLNAVTLRTPAAVPELSSILTVGLAGVFAFGAIRLGKRFGLSFKV